MQTILLTGGAGYIGSHLCLSLLKDGYDVVVLDSFINSYPNSLKKVISLLNKKYPNRIKNLHIFEGDLRSLEIINNIFSEFYKSENCIKAVIHLAGLKYVEESFKNPLSYWETNVVGTVNLLKAMSNYDCKKLIFSSSASIYGETNKILKENDPIKPTNPYSKTKYAVEQILQDFSVQKRDWSFIILRYFNPIGAHYSGIIGEQCKGKNKNIFPTINDVALGLKNELKIFGNDWDTLDGTCIRDYIHVMDLANGHFYSLEYLINNPPKILNLNLGTGIGTSVLDLIKTFERVNKINVSYQFTQRRKGDAAVVVADNSLVKNILKWKPEKNLDDMCRDGWKWKKLNPKGYR